MPASRFWTVLRQTFTYAFLTAVVSAGVFFFLNPAEQNALLERFYSEIEARADDPPETIEVPTQEVESQKANEDINEALVQNPETTSTLTADDAELLSINKIPLEYTDQAFSPQDILDDKLNLLPQDFKVPSGLKKRVAFWLDVYTKYSSHFSLLHDAKEPWVVYRIIDLRPIYDRDENRFTKDANDKRAVGKARREVRGILLKLAKKSNFRNLTSEEYEIYKLLESRKGFRRHTFLEAAHNLRTQRGQKDFYRNGLISSSRYLSEMEDIFARYDLPVELVRLPLVESSFNLEATSKAGAGGVWQFMTGMGRKYLRVGGAFDERISPIKATEAAAKLMLSNFRVTHSWPLAITAFNHGAGGVMRACKRLHTTSIADVVAKIHSHGFGFASQNYFAEYLAALYGEKYQDKVFGVMPKYSPLEAESTDLKYSMRAKTLVNIVGMTVEELKLYNPDLKAQAIAGSTFLPVGYHIRLPVGRKNRLELFNQEADEAHSYVTKANHHRATKI